LTKINGTCRGFAGRRQSRQAVFPAKLSPRLTADIDAWAETHQLTRADAIGRLLELALAVSPPQASLDAASGNPLAIEREAIGQIEAMLDLRCRPTTASAASAT
jgi:hypothetical protein